MNVYAVMRQLAADLQPHLSRPVTADPSRTGNTPCVLIGLPEFDDTAVLCGSKPAQLDLLVIGLPGPYAELQPLSDLLEETINALETIGCGYSRLQPIAYTPLNETGTADACTSYQITVERFV